MIELNDWLSIDKVSGEGNDIITLTALPCGVTEEKNSSLKIKTSTKEVVLNIKQKYFDKVERFLDKQKELISSEWQGCTKTVVVYTNEEDLFYEAPSWVDVTVNKEGFVYTYTITFKPNTSNTKRFGELVLRTYRIIYAPIKLVQGIEAEENKVIYYMGAGNTNASIIPPYNTSGMVANTSERIVGSINSYNIGFVYYDSPVVNVVDNFFDEQRIYAISFPPSVKTIGKRAFNESTIYSVDFSDNITSIGEYAFYDCERVVGTNSIELLFGRLDLPSKLETIGNYAFYNCYGVTEVNLPSTLQTIGESAFARCTRITNIEFNNGLKTIGKHAFNSLSLTEIIIPNTLTSIGDYAFAWNYVEYVELPANGITLGSNILYGCDALSKIKILPSTGLKPTIKNDTFQEIASNGILEYPQGSDYSDWLSSSSYYLGYYNWTGSPY